MSTFPIYPYHMIRHHAKEVWLGHLCSLVSAQCSLLWYWIGSLQSISSFPDWSQEVEMKRRELPVCGVSFEVKGLVLKVKREFRLSFVFVEFSQRHAPFLCLYLNVIAYKSIRFDNQPRVAINCTHAFQSTSAYSFHSLSLATI